MQFCSLFMGSAIYISSLDFKIALCFFFPVNLWKIYKAVETLGGYDAVSILKQTKTFHNLPLVYLPHLSFMPLIVLSCWYIVQACQLPKRGSWEAGHAFASCSCTVETMMALGHTMLTAVTVMTTMRTGVHPPPSSFCPNLRLQSFVLSPLSFHSL